MEKERLKQTSKTGHGGKPASVITYEVHDGEWVLASHWWCREYVQYKPELQAGWLNFFVSSGTEYKIFMFIF